MRTKGISLALILLVGSLVAPMGIQNVQALTIPSSPTNLSATSVSNSKINLSWAAPSDAIANQVNGYKIEIGAGCIGIFTTLIANTTTTSTTYSSTGLISGLCYEYRVSALNSAGTSAPSNVVSATTWSVPNAPTNLNANAISSSQINLTWSAPSSSGGTPVNGYKIERRNSCSGNFSILVANTTNPNTTYSNTGLVNGTCYQYHMFALNAVGSSLSSNNATATTLQTPTSIHVPSAPTGLSVSVLSKNALKLTWSAPSDLGGAPIIGYKIQRNGTTLVNNTGSAQTNYTNTGLLASHQQTYRVAAWNSAGLGPYSNNATGKTMDQTATVSSVTENLGQMVSEFVHKYNAIFKEQRDETIKAIKECIQKVRDASPENRKQVKSDCKAELSAIREKYKDERRQFQIEFKQFKETAKAELKIARESVSIAKSDVKEFQKDLNHAKKELKEQEKELKKEIKTVEKEIKKKSKDKNHEEDD